MRLNDDENDTDTSSTGGNRMVVTDVQFMYVPTDSTVGSDTVTISSDWFEVPPEHDLFAWNAGPPAWPWPLPPRELGTRGREAPEPETPPPKRQGATLRGPCYSL